MKNNKILIIIVSIQIILVLILGIYSITLALEPDKQTKIKENEDNIVTIINEEDSKNNYPLLEGNNGLNKKDKDIEELSNNEIDNRIKYTECNNIDFSNLEEPGWILEYEDDFYQSLIGIDVSEYNGDVNFKELKESGIDFVMIRVGWRGYTKGNINDDKKFEEYYENAKKADLKIGYYFFSQAVNKNEAEEEANYVLEKIKDKKCDLFIAFDMESAGEENGRIYNLNRSERTNVAIKFCNTISENGYYPLIYTNSDWIKNYYSVHEFDDIPIWYAQYNGYPDVNFNYTMWQYTSKATVGGSPLKGKTDLNLMLIKK